MLKINFPLILFLIFTIIIEQINAAYKRLICVDNLKVKCKYKNFLK